MSTQTKSAGSPASGNKPKTTNAVFASGTDEFRRACEFVGIEPSTRQAGKWRRHTGLAYTRGRNR